ncbi:unnamed protein product [Lupinus luteus]|uniref:Uncharacterized protein n=1 Tax=Lupinus luteus TaxID=3873 RepID=A0AAV1XXK3_LUPLU
MASSMRVFVLFLIVFTLLVVSYEARVLTEFTNVSEKGKSEILLRDLIHKYQKKRSMLGLERISPAGPDPQHH